MLSNDIRKLCDDILAAKTGGVSEQQFDVVEKVASDSLSSDAAGLIEEIDEALSPEESSASFDSKIALAMLLAAGDIMAQGR